MYRRCLKRTLDIVVVMLSAPLVAPLCAVIALIVRIQMGSPVLFRQSRPGLGERSFRLLKFRTMWPPMEVGGRALLEFERITAVGRLLRKTSLDELPQLWNVLRGDMSLVGPRPLMEEYLPYYTAEERKRHWLRPGITGWAQVNGRNKISPDARLAMDAWYVDHLTWKLDLFILLKTIPKVLAAHDIQLSPADEGPNFIGERQHRLEPHPAEAPERTDLYAHTSFIARHN